jgi:glycosyltransferase involved in cell wall biosynthesis
MELTILMPCLNEAETITTCIRKAQSFLKMMDIEGEILIADNGSHDGSQGLAQAEGARVIHVESRGYGAALWAGIQDAKGRYVIMGDADDSYDFSRLVSFIGYLRSGYELVVGNRFKGAIRPGAMPFLNQYVGNPFLSLLGRSFFRSPVKDFHCGLRGFHRETIQALDLQSTGMEFASEMIAKAALKQLKMAETPITLSPDGRSRKTSHLRPWRDGFRHAWLLLQLKMRNRGHKKTV